MTTAFVNKCIRNARYFFIPYFIFLLAAGLFLIFSPKGTLLLFLNENHNDFLDLFFKFLTNLGDGLFVLFLLPVAAFFSLRRVLVIFVSFLISGAFAQLLKRIFDMPRPRVYFEGKELLHFVQGVTVYAAHSFPSGHSATAFSFCLALALMTKSRMLIFLAFFLAVMIAISRVYLNQHFLIDIYFGSIVGVLSTLMTEYIFRSESRFGKFEWLDFSFIKKKKS